VIQLVWPDRCGCLLAGELASPLRCLVLNVGLFSMGSCSLPLLKSVLLLKREAGVWPRCQHLRWNYHHGLSGQNILQPWCGYDRGRHSLCTMPSRRGEAGDPLSTRSHVELLGGVLYHGPLWVEPMKAAPKSFLMGERFKLSKQSAMNSILPKQTVLPREKSPHIRRSPLVETTSIDE
jgi:hypothetical protein